MTLQYDIEKYEEIKNEGFSIELPEYTINIVNQLAEQVGAPTYNKTPVFENREYKKKKNNKNQKKKQKQTKNKNKQKQKQKKKQIK